MHQQHTHQLQSHSCTPTLVPLTPRPRRLPAAHRMRFRWRVASFFCLFCATIRHKATSRAGRINVHSLMGNAEGYPFHTLRTAQMTSQQRRRGIGPRHTLLMNLSTSLHNRFLSVIAVGLCCLFGQTFTFVWFVTRTCVLEQARNCHHDSYRRRNVGGSADSPTILSHTRLPNDWITRANIWGLLPESCVCRAERFPSSQRSFSEQVFDLGLGVE